MRCEGTSRQETGANNDTSTQKMGRRSKNFTYNTSNDCVINFTLRGIDLRNRHKTSTENIRTDTQQGRETTIRSFCDLQNGKCTLRSGLPNGVEMRELNTTIVAPDQTLLHQPQDTR
jgi:hypothetical protein